MSLTINREWFPALNHQQNPYGTIYALPIGHRRDITLLNLVRHTLHLHDDSKLTCWILVTSYARLQSWYTLIKEHTSTKTQNSNPDEDDYLPHDQIPCCIAIMTYDQLGNLEWFSEISSNIILVMDEAHNLIPHVRRSPSIMTTLKQYGRIFYFTYDLLLADLGFLLRTFNVPENNAIHRWVQNFPLGENETHTRFLRHYSIKTIAKFASEKGCRSMWNFVTVLFVINNINRYIPTTSLIFSKKKKNAHILIQEYLQKTRRRRGGGKHLNRQVTKTKKHLSSTQVYHTFKKTIQ